MIKTPILGLCSVGVLTLGSLTISAQRPQRYAPHPPMTGTYELDRGAGDDPQRAADAATRSLPPGRRERAYQDLLARLDPPRTLSIDRRGSAITISSSTGPRTTFDADGQLHSEPGPNGRMVSTRAEIRGNLVTVSTTGNRGSDFEVTFESVDNGERLLVARRMDSDELGQPVTVQSYYHRVADEPRWDLFNDAPMITTDPYEVSDGMRLVATLDTPLSTRNSRNGDRFTMTVRSPRQFEGARIDGVVSRVNQYQRSNNRADMVVNFQTIRLRGGQTSEFRAMLETVRTPDGDTVRVDVEGGVRENDTTDTRVEHGAIGAALGAIIGAVAGGGKGALVGGIIGGAGGAILVEGRDQLDLPPGTEVSIIATPRYR